MRVLLDTHIALWALTDSPGLSAAARRLISNPSNEIYFSAATIWEIAIKHALAQRDMPVSGEEARQLFLESGYLEVPIRAVHAAAAETLPRHHADPFDRMLIAQAYVEPMRLLTSDRQLAEYGDLVHLA